MVTVISRFRVRNGLEEEVRRAFLDRPRLVEKAAGFCGLDVLTDAATPSVFLLLTRWTDESSFRAWHRSEAHHQSHAMMPQGLKLDATFTSLTIGHSIVGSRRNPNTKRCTGRSDGGSLAVADGIRLCVCFTLGARRRHSFAK